MDILTPYATWLKFRPINPTSDLCTIEFPALSEKSDTEITMPHRDLDQVDSAVETTRSINRLNGAPQFVTRGWSKAAKVALLFEMDFRLQSQHEDSGFLLLEEALNRRVLGQPNVRVPYRSDMRDCLLTPLPTFPVSGRSQRTKDAIASVLAVAPLSGATESALLRALAPGWKSGLIELVGAVFTAIYHETTNFEYKHPPTSLGGLLELLSEYVDEKRVGPTAIQSPLRDALIQAGFKHMVAAAYWEHQVQILRLFTTHQLDLMCTLFVLQYSLTRVRSTVIVGH